MSTVDDVGKVCTLEVPYGPFPVNWKPPHFMEGVTGCGRHSSICGPSLSVCLSDCRCPSSPLFHLSGLPLAGHPHVWLACDRRISSLGHWRWRRSEDKFHFFFSFFLKSVFIRLFCHTQCGQIACFNFAMQISVAAHFEMHSKGKMRSWI